MFITGKNMYLKVVCNFFLPLHEDTFSLLLEREGRETDRQTNINFIAFSYVPRLGIQPTTWKCALIRIRTRALYGLQDDVSITASHQPGQSSMYF